MFWKAAAALFGVCFSFCIVTILFSLMVFALSALIHLPFILFDIGLFMVTHYRVVYVASLIFGAIAAVAFLIDEVLD